MERSSASREQRQAWTKWLHRSVAAAVACELCPDVTPERGLAVLTSARHWPRRRGTPLQRSAAQEVLEQPGWRQRMLDWVDDYNRAHGHGPSWRVYRAEPALWPTEVPRPVQDAVLTLLSLAGDLNGTKTPYALRCRIHPAAEPTAPTPRQRTADALCSESAWSR